MSGRLFLTGGTGLIGSHVAALFRERGWSVRALIRPESGTAFLESLGCEFVLGDLAEPRTFSGAAEACDAVVHAGAHLGSPAPWERYREINVEGTRHVLAECIRAGCPRFVHLSSVAVYGALADHPRLPLDEDASTEVPVAQDDHYERSKRMAEAVLRRTAGSGVEWCILRPAVVMGERDRQFTPRMIGLSGLAAAGRVLVPTVGPGDNELPVVYAGNVAEACWLGATHPAAAGRTYNVAADGGITQRELLVTAARSRSGVATGSDARGRATTVPIPRALVEGTVRALRRVSPLVPRGMLHLLNARRLWFISHPNPFSTDRLRAELGWEPRVSTLEGWKRSLDWHRRHGSRATS